MARQYRGFTLRGCWKWLLGSFVSLHLIVPLPASGQWDQNLAAGRRLQQSGHYSEAAQAYQAALTEARAFGEADPRFLTVMGDLGSLHHVRANYAEAERLYRLTLAGWERAARPDPDAVAAVAHNLGELLRSRADYPQAEHYLLKSAAIRRQAPGPTDARLAATLRSLAELHLDKGRPQQALEPALESLEIAKGALGPEHLDVARGLLVLARVHRAQGLYSQAEHDCRSARQIIESSGAAGPVVTDSLIELALAQKALGRLRDAERAYRRALLLLNGAPEPNRFKIAVAQANLALVLREAGRVDVAERELRGALPPLERVLGTDHPEVAALHYNLAVVLQDRKNHGAAMEAYQKALGTFMRRYGSRHARVAACMNGLGALAFDLGRLDEARQWFSQALTAIEATVGDTHPDFSLALQHLATVHLARARYAEAEPLLERSISVMERSLGPEHPAGVGGLLLYGELLRKTKRGRLARAFEARAKAVVARWNAENGLGHTIDFRRLKDQRIEINALRNTDGRQPVGSGLPGDWHWWQQQTRTERGGQERLFQ